MATQQAETIRATQKIIGKSRNHKIAAPNQPDACERHVRLIGQPCDDQSQDSRDRIFRAGFRAR